MKITIANDKKQVEVIKAMASRNKEVANKAQEAVAAYVTPAINEALLNAPTLSNFWTTQRFNEDDTPTIPIDLYTDTDDDLITVWESSKSAGLATNRLVPSNDELTVQTMQIETAYSFDRKHAAKSRLDVIGKSLAFLGNQILKKQEKKSAELILQALASGSTNGKQHVMRSNTAGEFKLADYNRLMTLLKRIHTAKDGGTPMDDMGGTGITDLLISPEISEQIRNVAFNPQNTRGTKTDIAAPDQIRNAAFNSAGVPNFFGVNLWEFREMGVGSKWNTLFDVIAGATTFPGVWGTTGSSASAFAATEELIIGIDRSRDSLWRPALTSSTDMEGVDYGPIFSIYPDDQFVARQNTIGWWGGLEEGRVIIDDRAIVGLIV